MCRFLHLHAPKSDPLIHDPAVVSLTLSRQAPNARHSVIVPGAIEVDLPSSLERQDRVWVLSRAA